MRKLLCAEWWIVVVLAVAVVIAPGTASAQIPLSTSWGTGDVGTPVLTGSSRQSAGVLTVDAAGVDIWGTSDQFHFVYQRLTGDGEIIARVEDVTAANAWSKAGVMIRRSLDPGAPHGYALVSAGKGVHFQRRAANGGTSTSTAGTTGGVAPAWVKAVRKGSKVSAYWSPDGSQWTLIGSQTLALDPTAYYGVAVTSHDGASRTTADVRNVVIIPAGLPAGQQGVDIGSPAVAGSSSYLAGIYTIQGAGADIWGTADQFHYVYQALTGDAEVTARVTSVVRADAWSKAGVMIRESLTAQSRHAMMVASAGKGYAFQRRPETAGLSVNTAGPSGIAPGWVRLVRSGDLFEAYQSSDGSTWTKVGSDTIPMGTTVYAGLAVTSHNPSLATTALIDSFKVVPKSAPSNQPPTVSITNPAAGSQFTAPATVTIAANASDPEGRMAGVDFYVDSTLIGRDTSSPYSFSWSASTPGTYLLTAVASDSDGGTTTSGAVSVTVTAANQPPAVSLTSPANGAIFTAPATINLAASASDSDGTIVRVEFYSGTTLLGTDTSAPYAFSWTGVAAGTYSLTAAAYDEDGAKATSAAVSVTVQTSTTTVPRQVVFTASSDHASNVTSYRFDVFASGADPSTATPVATAGLGKPTPDGNNDITSDQSTLFGNLAAGNYIATVTAIGPGGSTRSLQVSFTR